MIEILPRIIFLLILICLSAFFSGVEVALVSISRIKIKQFLNENKKGSKSLARLHANPERMIVTVLIGNNLANIGAAALTTEIFIVLFGSIGVGIATGILTAIILIFGEITPKAYCKANAEKISLKVARTIEILSYILYPVVKPLEALSRDLINLLMKKRAPSHITESELKALIDIGVEERVIEARESQMMENILQLNDLPARAVLTPRTKMFYLNSNLKIKEALPIINRKRYTRIPIIEDSKDNVVGIVHLRDLLKLLELQKIDLTLKEVSRKPFFASQEKKISNLVREMQGRKNHLAIIIDEFGGVEGVVTLEDIIEEIFGEIMDEKDTQVQHITTLEKNKIVAHGDTEIEEVNQYLEIALPRGDDYSTISGLLHEKLFDIPQEGDRITIANVKMIVEEMNGITPVKVRIEKINNKEI